MPGPYLDKRPGKALQYRLLGDGRPCQVELLLNRFRLVRDRTACLEHGDRLLRAAGQPERASEAVERVRVVHVGLPGGSRRERLDRPRVEVDRRVVVTGF